MLPTLVILRSETFTSKRRQDPRKKTRTRKLDPDVAMLLRMTERGKELLRMTGMGTFLEMAKFLQITP
jgi:hypothetical protein